MPTYSQPSVPSLPSSGYGLNVSLSDLARRLFRQFFLQVRLFARLSVCYVCLFFYLFVCMFFNFVYLYVYLSACLFFCPSVRLSIRLFACQSGLEVFF